jgi:hypothetical protein
MMRTAFRLPDFKVSSIMRTIVRIAPIAHQHALLLVRGSIVGAVLTYHTFDRCPGLPLIEDNGLIVEDAPAESLNAGLS